MMQLSVVVVALFAGFQACSESFHIEESRKEGSPVYGSDCGVMDGSGESCLIGRES